MSRALGFGGVGFSSVQHLHHLSLSSLGMISIQGDDQPRRPIDCPFVCAIIVRPPVWLCIAWHGSWLLEWRWASGGAWVKGGGGRW